MEGEEGGKREEDQPIPPCGNFRKERGCNESIRKKRKGRDSFFFIGCTNGLWGRKRGVPWTQGENWRGVKKGPRETKKKRKKEERTTNPKKREGSKGKKDG